MTALLDSLEKYSSDNFWNDFTSSETIKPSSDEVTVERIRECLCKGADLNDTLNAIWLEHEAQGLDLTYQELNAFVIQAVKEL